MATLKSAGTAVGRVRRQGLAVGAAVVAAAALLGAAGAAGAQPRATASNTSTFVDGLTAVPGGGGWAFGKVVDFASGKSTGFIAALSGTKSKGVRIPAVEAVDRLAAASRTQAIAVGNTSSGAPWTGLWNGTAWRTATLPVLVSHDEILDVSAAGSADYVLAQSLTTGSGVLLTYTHSKWSTDTIPNLYAPSAVAAVSASTVWATGKPSNSSATADLVRRYRGHWAVIARLTDEAVEGLAATSSTEAWAWGYNETTGASTVDRVLNGRVTAYKGANFIPRSVSMPTSSFGFVAGVTGAAKESGSLQRWNGKKLVSDTPRQQGDATQLLYVAASSPKQAWLYGDGFTGTAPCGTPSAINFYYWNGRTWTRSSGSSGGPVTALAPHAATVQPDC